MQQQHHLSPRAEPDEGYSDDTSNTPTPYDTDTEMLSAAPVDPLDNLRSNLLTLPVTKRFTLLRDLIPTLPNPLKEDLSRLIETLLHFDPILYLPPELVLNCFSYLGPEDLLIAGTVSRGWRRASQDERLWRLCFRREGWVLDRSRVEGFERVAEEGRRRGKLGLERRGSRKRGRDEAFLGEGEIGGGDGAVESERQSALHTEDEGMMEGIEGGSSGIEQPSSQTSDYNTTASTLTLAPQLFQPSTPTPKLSWPYLYKHRRRLEANWENGRYTMFRLPHPDHLDEGHKECVYTIQHTPLHLVSGSRDTTIRIWDLTTYRLKCQPLRGHEASVLCLQYDESPGNDIIVSGGSDAYVIIWRFSTGEILKKMTNAHSESVLNLRFDDRYIVTCSKDKTIKIWNRHGLAQNSPLLPVQILDHLNLNPLTAGEMVKEYTLLSTLRGHHAAVNAVMIHNTTIVSASGDRTIKSWDLLRGTFKRNYLGHNKGIACVQFDGRRIVSGSSDNSVRIFDAERQAEVACLRGHGNLVRTVQARFGDLETTTTEELALEARRADAGFYRAIARGMEPHRHSRQRFGAAAAGAGARNAGSSRPEEMLSVGTRVPPGGGGSRWAKIVSGSYDETVILWMKDREGRWVARRKFTLDEGQVDQENGPGRLRGSRREAVVPDTGGPYAAGPAQAQAQAQAQSRAWAHAQAAAEPAAPAPGIISSLATNAMASLTEAQAELLAPDYESQEQDSAPAGARNYAHQLIGNAQRHLLQANQLLQPGQTQTQTQTQTQQQLGVGNSNDNSSMQSPREQQQQQAWDNDEDLEATSSNVPITAAATEPLIPHAQPHIPQPALRTQALPHEGPTAGPSSPPTASALASAPPADVPMLPPIPQQYLPRHGHAHTHNHTQQQHQHHHANGPISGQSQHQPQSQHQQQHGQPQHQQHAHPQQHQHQHPHHPTLPVPVTTPLPNPGIVPNTGQPPDHLAHQPQRPETNRVFKLQFDARRIVCCSQNRVIVGWDFANGDLDLERVGSWSLETP